MRALWVDGGVLTVVRVAVAAAVVVVLVVTAASVRMIVGHA